MIFFVPRDWLIFFCPKRLGDFFLSREVGLVCFVPRGLVILKASALWADAFYKSKCPSVRVSVCSLLRYRLNVFLPPLPGVGCSKLLEIRNPWGKVMERRGLRFAHFCLEIVLNRRAKKVFFADFVVQNMLKTTLPDG